MDSLWLDSAVPPVFPTLEKEIETDVLIIGGGITGLLCAFLLQKAGRACVVAEAKTICSGITKNTTAKITIQHGLLYQSLLRRFGPEKARLYLCANNAALAKYKALCPSVDCGFSVCDSFVYETAQAESLKAEIAALKQIGYTADFVPALPLPFPVAGAVRFQEQARFQPLQFLFAIAKTLPIFEHTEVKELNGTTARTENGVIHAKKVICATHFPFLNRHGGYFLKLTQHRSYVLGLKNAPPLQGLYTDAAENGLSFRRAGALLLVGGGGHKTGKAGGGYAALRAFVKRAYPAAEEVCSFATQDCMTLDGVPYIGPYSAATKDLFVATGFNKWGMTSAMVAAMLLSDLVQGKRNPFAPVFSPSRSVFHPKLAENVASSVVHLLTPTRPRCPHMGCALQWNREEQSWDCPCHGSRFTKEGHLIDNPATFNLPRRF